MHMHGMSNMIRPTIAYPSLGIACILLLFFLFSSLSTKVPFTVQWQEERLSVIAEKAPLADILREVTRQTGHKVGNPESLREKISIRFFNLPLQEGIHRLLSSTHRVIYEEKPQRSGSLLAATPTIEQAAKRPIKNGMEEDTGLLEEAVLNDPDPNTRLVSIQKLTRNEDGRLEDILDAAAKDPDPSIRQLAYRHLYKVDKAKAAEILFQDSANPDGDIRMTAIESSSQLLGTEAMEILRDATEDSDPYIKQMAFQQLAQMKSDQGMEVIRKRLFHTDPEIRIMAIEAMASKGEQFAREAALPALDDNDELVRGKAEGLLNELEASGN